MLSSKHLNLNYQVNEKWRPIGRHFFITKESYFNMNLEVPNNFNWSSYTFTM